MLGYNKHGMEEYNTINWRGNMLEEDQNFFDIDVYTSSYSNQFLNDKLNLKTINKDIDALHKSYNPNNDFPGKKYFVPDTKDFQRSRFSSLEHQRLINALKVMQSGKTMLNKLEISERELLNNSQNNIIAENKEFLAYVEGKWKVQAQKGLNINNKLKKYALDEREAKLQGIMKLPQYYQSVDAIPWNYDASDVAVQMIHAANVLDLGVVSQYLPPLLDDPCTLDINIPNNHEVEYFSKLPISNDANIEDYLLSGNVDVAISISALKKLFYYMDTQNIFTLPVVIKQILLSSGRSKKVIFIDKPLLKQTVTNEDMNLRCHKLLVRANLCCLEALRCPVQDKRVITDPPDNTKTHVINHNVSYKLWCLREEACEQSFMLKNRSNKSFNVLVRTKNDACVPCDFGLQSVTVVPKLEYQLRYGANVFSNEEIMKQWTDLFFRPSSLLKRVRTQYLTSEVVKIESANLQKLCLEASQHNLKTQTVFSVLYKLLLGLDQHKDGSYLLRHHPKNGKFVSLLKVAQDNLALNVFDLHKEYMTNSSVCDYYVKPWTAIDTTVILPAFEHHGHFPGLFKPSTKKVLSKGKQVYNKIKKKKKKKPKRKKTLSTE